MYSNYSIREFQFALLDHFNETVQEDHKEASCCKI